jgi:hypothetical protein
MGNRSRTWTDTRKAHESRNAGGFWKLEKAKKQTEASKRNTVLSMP